MESLYLGMPIMLAYKPESRCALVENEDIDPMVKRGSGVAICKHNIAKHTTMLTWLFQL